MKKNDDFYVSFFTSRPFSPAYRQFACLARQEACLSRSAGAAGLPVSLGRGGGLAPSLQSPFLRDFPAGGRFWGRRTPKIAGNASENSFAGNFQKRSPPTSLV